jgi:hypothetical protein
MNHRIMIDTNTIIHLHTNDTRPDCVVGHTIEDFVNLTTEVI